MAKAAKEKKANPKQTLRKEVAEKLSSTFSEIKESIGDKKFEKKIKKAAKVLTSGKVKAAKAVKPVKKAKQEKKS